MKNGRMIGQANSFSGASLAPPWHRLGIDSLCSGAAATHPSRLFLFDCPDKLAWSGEAPRAIGFGEFDKQARFFASQLAALGIAQGDCVMLAVPASVDAAIAFAGTMIAGCVPALIGCDESVDTLRAAADLAGASAIITADRIEDMRLAEKLRQVAARAFSVRCVAGFGADLPDGVVSLAGWSEEDVLAMSPVMPRPQGADALITFGREGGRLRAFLRSEAQLMADALALAAVSKLDRGQTIISTLQPGSSAGLIGAFLLPMFVGASVQMVGPFHSERFHVALEDAGTAHLLAPAHMLAALLPKLKDDARLSGLSGVIALARPEDLHGVLAGTLSGLPLGILLDFHEIANAIFDADGGAGVLLGSLTHPMEGVIPDEAPQLVIQAFDGKLRPTGGFALAHAQDQEVETKRAAMLR